MLKDLTKADWLTSLAIPEERVPQALILRGTRNLGTRYGAHRLLIDDVLEIGSPNGLFEDVFIGTYRGMQVGYASVYGPAMASEITQLFGVLGTRLVIQTGNCGALGDGIVAGDLVVADIARCAEGAANYYLPGFEHVSATPELVERVRADPSIPIPVHSGPIWTTAALLAESNADIARWHSEGYIAVDMETATTFAVAEHYGMERLSILYTFDNPRAGSHLGLAEADKQEARDAGERAMLEVVFRLLI